jgi:murein L,D-transpeptidase YcbB/YkuD
MMKPPNYQKDAIPTLKGWKHPKRNEILVNKKFTQKEIDDYLKTYNPNVKKLKAKPKPKPVKNPIKKIKATRKENGRIIANQAIMISETGELLFAGEKRKATIETKSIVKRAKPKKVELKKDVEYDYSQILVKGSTGSGVERMSHALGLPFNSYFSSNIEWKLKDYQAKKGLVDDGIFGPKTQKKLYGLD